MLWPKFLQSASGGKTEGGPSCQPLTPGVRNRIAPVTSLLMLPKARRDPTNAELAIGQDAAGSETKCAMLCN
jgi:hypothetical protein